MNIIIKVRRRKIFSLFLRNRKLPNQNMRNELSSWQQVIQSQITFCLKIKIVLERSFFYISLLDPPMLHKYSSLEFSNTPSVDSKGTPPQSTISQDFTVLRNGRRNDAIQSHKREVSSKIRTGLYQRKVQSEIKLIEKSKSKKKQIEDRLFLIEENLEQVKSLFKKRKQKKIERDVVRQKIREGRKRSDQQLGKAPMSLNKNQIPPQHRFIKNLLTPDTKANLSGLVTQVPQTKTRSFKYNPYEQNFSTYYVSQVLKAYNDEESTVTEHVLNSMEQFRFFQQLQFPDEKTIANKKLKLPKKPGYEDKKTIIFDLDETLIHCNQNSQLDCDVILPIRFPKGDIIQAGINIRPGAFSILSDLSKYFQIIVFTASHFCYGNVVINHLDPEGKYIHHRLFRQHCYYIKPNGPYVKDLRILDRDLSKVVLVDNAAYSYLFQKDNGVPIIPYYSGEQDYELQALSKYLKSLLEVEDVRDANRKVFGLNQYNRFETYEELVKELYKKQ